MIILRQKDFSDKVIECLKKLSGKRVKIKRNPHPETLEEGFNRALRRFSDTGREPVSKEDLERAKKSGVVQRKPNGKWGIIAIRKKLWWRADYDSKASAEAALAAYHANKRK